ncbi:hypothetical protein GQX73_g403 [Xylaria multiplex]|uniref:Zn(2)-C6 fungal-type domain-containing protein n=1 Tax=Xylaria multiplex TaxID=323545 RepID=A0A7C8MY44_9PEZI|nr:hypothetical protein GQX73_g403 [Xylaria multiplex]
MYGTLRFDSNNTDKVLIQKPVDPTSARPAVQQACQSCRDKKVKCSGERSGCNRCKTLSKPCTYSSRPSKRARNTKIDVEAVVVKPHQQQETTTQPQPSPQYQQNAEREREREMDCSPKAQQDIDFSAMDVVDANGPAMMDFDVEGLVSWPTPGFVPTNDTEPSPVAQLDQLGGNSATGLSHGSEALSIVDVTTPIEHWLNNFKNTNATTPPQSHSQPDAAATASLFGSWPPNPSPTQLLAATTPSITKPKRHSLKILASPASTTLARDRAKPRAASSTSRTSSSSSSPPLPLEPCSCLQHVAFLVHELETARTESLDGQLASHKEAVDYGQAMLQLLQLSETLVGRLVQQQQQQQQQQGGGGGVGVGSGDRPAIVFGELEISSTPEWELLVSSLTAVYLGSLHRLMGQLKKSAEGVSAEMTIIKALENVPMRH